MISINCNPISHVQGEPPIAVVRAEPAPQWAVPSSARSAAGGVPANVYANFGPVEIMVLRGETQNTLQKPRREDYATRWFDRNYGFESRGPKYITKTNTGSLRNGGASPQKSVVLWGG